MRGLDDIAGERIPLHHTRSLRQSAKKLLLAIAVARLFPAARAIDAHELRYRAVGAACG